MYRPRSSGHSYATIDQLIVADTFAPRAEAVQIIAKSHGIRVETVLFPELRWPLAAQLRADVIGRAVECLENGDRTMLTFDTFVGIRHRLIAEAANIEVDEQGLRMALTTCWGGSTVNSYFRQRKDITSYRGRFCHVQFSAGDEAVEVERLTHVITNLPTRRGIGWTGRNETYCIAAAAE